MKEIFQRFADFRGRDVRSSDLGREANYAQVAQNYEIETNFSLGGANGFKTTAPLMQTNLTNAMEDSIVGIHNYIHKDVETGETKEELIGLGKSLYRLVKKKITISSVSYTHLTLPTKRIV